MAFANTDSITATDVNNMLRGLHRNNADSAHTGDTNITDLSSFAMTGGTMGATGRIIVEAAGTVTGSAGSKTIQLFFGATGIWTTGVLAGTNDWLVRATISNTATGAQRIVIEASRHDGNTYNAVEYTAAAIDTTASVDITCKVTLANSGDTVTQTKFEIQVQQIT